MRTEWDESQSPQKVGVFSDVVVYRFLTEECGFDGRNPLKKSGCFLTWHIQFLNLSMVSESQSPQKVGVFSDFINLIELWVATVLSQSPQKVGVFSDCLWLRIHNRGCHRSRNPLKKSGCFLTGDPVINFKTVVFSRNPLKKSGCFLTERVLADADWENWSQSPQKVGVFSDKDPYF